MTMAEDEKVKAVASLLGLRDKGRVKPISSGGEYDLKTGMWSWRVEKLIHKLCQEDLRIGITNDGTPVRYCSKCEVIIDSAEKAKLPDQNSGKHTIH